ncbi:molybdate transport system ATP-binding protein [Malonomonas rubra DSM 5091]|uniref:Molybdate transport system ATP-binding protein n=1 Tax=Malonomonas rubra DSM 5091 TaxID=1122189 RepID=A0A1M6N3H2_MALRU|nr:molybdenum ABC transporter ATP-binding protein [Malonomonas rubra]SHJ90311.1 molybdate transport system ATP-binding protein [Malonomonas rubra DSM 5091]
MKLNVEVMKSFGRFEFAAGFQVEGARIGIFGPSGSGKSTLSSLLAGLVSPDAGTIHLNDRCLFDSISKINRNPEQRRVSVVFQHAHLFPHLNVERNLLYGFHRTPAERRKLLLEDVAEALDISRLLKRSVSKLSGGEKQRVALGRALLACPDLLILDEPLSALDKRLKEQIIPFLRKTLRRFEIPYLYISHSLSEMRLLTDQVLCFADGQLQETSDAETLARQRMTGNRHGYLNHLELSEPREVGGMLGYRWGENELLLTDHEQPQAGLFELSSKDILLFKNHPHALSARNLLTAKITELIPQGGSVGVKLNCNGEELIAQIVREAALELNMDVGMTVYAAIKASAFRRLV